MFGRTGTEGVLFTVYRNGNVFDTTTEKRMTVISNPQDPYPPALEVLEPGEESYYKLGFPYAMFQWLRSDFANSYRIERFDDPDWVLVQNPLQPSTPEPIVQYFTGVLESNTSYEYRVLAVDTEGNESPVERLVFNFWRVPQPPRIVLSASGGNITVDLAS